MKLLEGLRVHAWQSAADGALARFLQDLGAEIVKCDAPFAIAHDFTAAATASAVVSSIFSCFLMEELTFLKKAGESVPRICSAPKTFSP